MGAKERLPFWREREQEKHGGERDVATSPSVCRECVFPPKEEIPRTGSGGALHF